MATYVKRKSPGGRMVWQARVRKKGYPQQIRTFDRKADAEAWAAEIEVRMRRGELVDYRPSAQTTIGDLVGRYLREVTPGKRGAEKETAHARMILADTVAGLSLQACTPAKVSEYRDRRLAKVSAATLNREITPTSLALSFRYLRRRFFHPARSQLGPPAPGQRRPHLPRRTLQAARPASRLCPGALQGTHRLETSCC